MLLQTSCNFADSKYIGMESSRVEQALHLFKSRIIWTYMDSIVTINLVPVDREQYLRGGYA